MQAQIDRLQMAHRQPNLVSPFFRPLKITKSIKIGQSRVQNSCLKQHHRVTITLTRNNSIIQVQICNLCRYLQLIWLLFKKWLKSSKKAIRVNLPKIRNHSSRRKLKPNQLDHKLSNLKTAQMPLHRQAVANNKRRKQEVSRCF